MYVTICGRFCLNEGGVAGCVNRMRAKFYAKQSVQIAGMIFQTRPISFARALIGAVTIFPAFQVTVW